MMDDEEYITADIPDEFKGLRACLRCSLIKTFEQFNDKGCENCEFIDLEGNKGRIEEEQLHWLNLREVGLLSGKESHNTSLDYTLLK
eukprot:gene8294-9866_t